MLLGTGIRIRSLRLQYEKLTMEFTLPILATLVAAATVLASATPVEADVFDISARDAAESTVFAAASRLRRAGTSKAQVI
jgi:hypothetical protein